MKEEKLNMQDILSCNIIQNEKEILYCYLMEDTYVGKANSPPRLHRYTYCANNPLRYTDPNGYFFSALFRFVTSIVVGAVRDKNKNCQCQKGQPKPAREPAKNADPNKYNIGYPNKKTIGWQRINRSRGNNYHGYSDK